MAISKQQIEGQDPLVEELRDIVGDENVLSERDELLVYECDGLPQHKHLPRAVVFPESTEETAEVLELLSGEGVSFAPRGAGTGLSGGALAIDRGVVIELARMRKILGIDPENRIARVQTGLVNAQLSRAIAMMDRALIRAVEASVFTAGLPIDAQAVLLVELDGVEAGIDDDAEKAAAILREYGARSVRSATDDQERKKLWAARKGAFGAVGRLSPDIMIQDAVVPRSRLPEVLAETYRISAQYHLQLANVFHAGDGNLHPLICFDLRRGDDLENVRQAGRAIMEACVRAGGSITGEHGVGLDKSGYLPLIFSDDDMDVMLRVRAAFDPSGLCNPGKIIPLPRGCGEARAVATQSVSEPRAVATGSYRTSGVDDPVATARGSDTSGSSMLRSAVPSANAATRLAGRISEAKVANELKRLVGGGNVIKFSETSLADKYEAEISERALVVAPATAGEAATVMMLARRERFAVIPAGAATFIDAGNVLSGSNRVLTIPR